jgi:transposase
MNTTRRTIGLDVHPDLFTAAILLGSDAATARVERVFDKLSISQLESWAKKHAQPSDDLIIEASGNTFHVAERLKALGFKVVVLESFQTSKLQKSYCVNDKISAVQIARAWLSGLAKAVWQPDARTRERREVFAAHRKTVKRTTQMRSRIRAFLNQHGVRIKHSISPKWQQQILVAAPWTPLQEHTLRSYLEELRHAEEQRKGWHGLIAREVLADPQLLQLTRLLGIRDLTAFALGAVIGTISRFSGPKKLVAYAGLNPSLEQSGNSSREGGLTGHGRGDLRAMLVQGAQAILRGHTHPFSRWGRKLALRRGIKVAVIAVARKLLVAVWYLLNGKYCALEEIKPNLSLKLRTIAKATPLHGALSPAETRALLAFISKRLLSERPSPTCSQPPAAV